MRVTPRQLELEAVEFDTSPHQFANDLRALGGEAYPTDTLAWDHLAGAYVLPDGRRVLAPVRGQFWGQRNFRGNDRKGLAGQHANAVIVATLPGAPSSAFALAYSGDYVVTDLAASWSVFTAAAFAETFRPVDALEAAITESMGYAAEIANPNDDPELEG